jgi:hypothetical protein
MRIALERSSTSSSGRFTSRPGREPPAPSRELNDVQARSLPQAQPSSELLALQRLVARRALPADEHEHEQGQGQGQGHGPGEQPAPTTEQIHQAAKVGTSGPSSSLPYLDAIQKSFGRYDVSDAKAHIGQEATRGARAMNAEAFASGNSIAFAGEPTLHTAAHEAAHLIQQRAGVQLAGGVGVAGDQYEQHADAVADLVVQGRSAEALLDRQADPGVAPIQRELEEEDPSLQLQQAEEEDEVPLQLQQAEPEEDEILT